MDKEQLKIRNIEQLEESTDKLKNITNKNPNHFKTKRLGSSMENYATQLERDVLGKRRRNSVFPQGTLVYVDFGVNYGSEFSSYHYAITLNKNDSKRDNTITVVPLTSKEGKQNIKLTAGISRGLTSLTLDYLEEQIKLNDNNMKKIESDLNKLEKREKNGEQFTKDLSQLKVFYQKVLLERNIVENAKERVKKYIKDFDKDTYIKIDAITTIDKNKIFKRKDNLDPLTKVRVNDDTLKVIENGIKNIFFKN